MRYTLLLVLIFWNTFAHAQDSLGQRKMLKAAPQYMLLDSVRWQKSDSLENIVKAKYQPESYFWQDRKAVNLFKGNQNQIKVRTKPSQWMYFLFLGMVLYYVLIRNFYAKSLSTIFQAYWNDRAISHFTRDDNSFKTRSSIMYFGLFCLVFSYIMYEIIHYFKFIGGLGSPLLYFSICAGVGAYYLSKYTLLKLSGLVFNAQKMVSGYLSIMSVSNIVFTVLMIPAAVFIHFLEGVPLAVVVYFVLAAYVFNTFYKYLRSGNFVLNNFQFPKFYLFLYLCTLEIMPLLVIYKIFVA